MKKLIVTAKKKKPKMVPVSKKRRYPVQSFWNEIDDSFLNFGKYGKRK